MKTTVLIDNKAQNGLYGEWGLSFHIEYQGKRYLLDSGGSPLFLENAAALKTDVSEVDYAVLSHAHFDHSQGLAAFFDINHKAPLYLSSRAAANCYSKSSGMLKYIGLPPEILESYSDRLIRTDGLTCIEPGVWIVPHSTAGLKSVARKSKLYVRQGHRLCFDDFSHEISLVFEIGQELAVFNSCSHSGPEVVVSEVLRAFPGKTVRAYFGGLHLFCLKEKEVEAVAEKLCLCPIRKIYTGHCTGDAAFDILKTRLGDRICEFCSGMRICF